MKPREMFGVGVRVVGLVCLLYMLSGISLLVGAVSAMMVVRWIIGVLLSLWLIRGASALVSFAYGGRDADGS